MRLFCIIHSLLQIGRWFPVFFIFGVSLWACYAYNVAFAFEYGENVTPIRVLLSLGFNVIYLLFCWSYLSTVMTPVGRPPAKFHLPGSITSQFSNCLTTEQMDGMVKQYVRDESVPVRTTDINGHIRYCGECNNIKPDRASHCSFCGHCVLKYDHHCVWVNNCVNFENYKYFVLFLFYGFMLCLYGFTTLLMPFVEQWKRAGSHTDLQILFLFFVTVMFGLSLACLFFFHVYLVSRNQTTIESVRAPVINGDINKRAYDLGVVNNFKQVFGKKCFTWCFPIRTSSGNGVSFPICRMNNERYSLLSTNDSDANVINVDDSSDEDDFLYDSHIRVV